MRIRTSWRSIAALGMTIVVPMSTAFGQRAFCFWPQPLPKCRTHPVLELEANHSLASTMGEANSLGARRSDYASASSGRRPFFSRYDLSIGAMHGDNEHRATGIVAAFALDRDAWPTRLELRRHYWIGEGGLSISGGLATRNIQKSVGTLNTLGLTVGARAETRYFGVQARAEVGRGEGRTISGVLVGAHSTTRTTPLAGALALIGAVVTFSFLVNRWE